MLADQVKLGKEKTNFVKGPVGLHGWAQSALYNEIYSGDLAAQFEV
jgi:hypothetical protein